MSRTTPAETTGTDSSGPAAPVDSSARGGEVQQGATLADDRVGDAGGVSAPQATERAEGDASAGTPHKAGGKSQRRCRQCGYGPVPRSRRSCPSCKAPYLAVTERQSRRQALLREKAEKSDKPPPRYKFGWVRPLEDKAQQSSAEFAYGELSWLCLGVWTDREGRGRVNRRADGTVHADPLQLIPETGPFTAACSTGRFEGIGTFLSRQHFKEEHRRSEVAIPSIMPTFDLVRDLASSIDLLTRLLFLARGDEFAAMARMVSSPGGRPICNNLISILQLLASDPEVLLGGGQETLALPDAAGTQQERAEGEQKDGEEEGGEGGGGAPEEDSPSPKRRRQE